MCYICYVVHSVVCFSSAVTGPRNYDVTTAKIKAMAALLATVTAIYMSVHTIGLTFADRCEDDTESKRETTFEEYSAGLPIGSKSQEECEEWCLEQSKSCVAVAHIYPDTCIFTDQTNVAIKIMTTHDADNYNYFLVKYRCPIHYKCEYNPCKNGGTCTSETNHLGKSGAKCDCPGGFKNWFCEDQLKCSDDPCNIWAACSTTPNNVVTCQCESGYTGYYCDEETVTTTCTDRTERERFSQFQFSGSVRTITGTKTLRECAEWCLDSVNCVAIDHNSKRKLCRYTNSQSVGVRTTRATFYPHLNHVKIKYRCPIHYTCENNPCIHGGICTTETTGAGKRGAKCNCAGGFKGWLCRDKVTCKDKPCKNNARCTVTSNRCNSM